jgi:hypothetical protein
MTMILTEQPAALLAALEINCGLGAEFWRQASPAKRGAVTRAMRAQIARKRREAAAREAFAADAARARITDPRRIETAGWLYGTRRAEEDLGLGDDGIKALQRAYNNGGCPLLATAQRLQQQYRQAFFDDMHFC